MTGSLGILGRATAALTGAAPLAGAILVALGVGAAASERSGGLLPVPAYTIERGTTITTTMLTEKHFYFDPDRPLAVITDPSLAIGKAARRTLAAGKPIPGNAFATAQLVKRGAPTEARYRIGNLVITATVLPQDDGGAGDLVRARNIDSGRTVTGVVASDGAIEVAAQ